MQGEEGKRVDEFKYVCSTVQEDRGSYREVIKRIQARWGACKKVMGITMGQKSAREVEMANIKDNCETTMGQKSAREVEMANIKDNCETTMGQKSAREVEMANINDNCETYSDT